MRTWFTLFIVCLLVGCGGQPKFEHRAEYEGLEPYAQEYVDSVLENYFGQPTDMVVWDRLPLDTHLATGTVVEGDGRTVKFELNPSAHTIAKGTEVLFDPNETALSGWIRSWDGDTQTAVLDEQISAPAAGTEVIVGPGQILANGRLLYAEHCQHCHGITGDGQGPTAQYLNPRPRDYRLGIFKFTTTQGAFRAQRHDLARIVENGIPGTYMPSFKLLTADEMDSIVEYVMWLSMRGEMEYLLVKFLSDGYSMESVKERVAAGLESRKAGAEEYETRASIKEEFIRMVNDPDEIPAETELYVELITSRWENSQTEDALVTPKESYVAYDEDSITKGRELYLSKELNCISCHGDAGFGDGPQTYSITKNLETGKDNPEPGLYDAWGNRIEPRNLHTGIFRGGRRPIDLYSRLHAGIKGTPMPAFGGKLTDEQMWNLVNYIYSVPFEKVVAGAGDVAEAEPETQPEATNENREAASLEVEASTDVAVNLN